jgi:hypothetical protein
MECMRYVILICTTIDMYQAAKGLAALSQLLHDFRDNQSNETTR